MKSSKSFLRYFILFIISHLVLFGFYYFSSVGIADKTFYLQMRRYMPCALAISLSFYFWFKNNLSFKLLLPHIIIGVAWIVTYPLLYWLSYHIGSNFIDNHFDIAFGAYIFAVTTSLHILFLSSNSIFRRLTTIFVSSLQFFLLLIPIFSLLYWAIYSNVITEAAWMAVLQTNKLEAKEFVLQSFGVFGLLSFILLALMLLVSLFYYNYRHTNNLSFPVFLSKKTLFILLAILLAAGSYTKQIFFETGVLYAYTNAKDYFVASEKFNAFHSEIFKELTVIKPHNTFANPSTFILIIGESASRDFMSAYRPLKNDTTPWMREMSTSPNFILFKNAYTSWGQTVPSLERALTEKNQYNSIEFNKATTILDIAKKAGYKTTWISNQGTISDADTPITLVAKTADKSIWLEAELLNANDKIQYDGNLLDYLNTINPAENNFIIIHFMGSHDNYLNRYPPEFTKWGTPNKYEPIINYDNSIAYTDSLLKKIYEYGIGNLNLQAMVYLSDHGADPNFKRNPDSSGFTALRIPLFLYLSNEYQTLYPETAKVLHNHAKSYFTNDLTYDFICGLLNIQSNHFNPEESLASPKYRYTRENLTTALGKRKLTEDTNLQN